MTCTSLNPVYMSLFGHVFFFNKLLLVILEDSVNTGEISIGTVTQMYLCRSVGTPIRGQLVINASVDDNPL